MSTYAETASEDGPEHARPSGDVHDVAALK